MWSKKAISRLLELYNDYTYSEIAEILLEEFGLDKSPNAIRKAYERYKYPVLEEKKNKPKILIFDLETLPMEVYTWSLWQDSTPLSFVMKDWSILSFCAKWYGEDDIIYHDTQHEKDIRNDKSVLKKLWDLIDEADIIVAHNLNAFDYKKMNARFILHGMKPPSSTKRMDTKLLAKRHFKFTSNKLEYLTDKLCTESKKIKHNDFPGFSMWKECLAGNPKAFKSMKEYNIMDVLSLEELFTKLLPWESASLFQLYNESDEFMCTCGAINSLKKNGFYRTNACKYQKYKCKKCGAETRDKKNLKVTNRRGTVR